MNLALRSPPKTGLLVGIKIKWVSLTCTCQILSKYRVLSLPEDAQGKVRRPRRGQEGRKACECRRRRVCSEGALAFTLLNVEDRD